MIKKRLNIVIGIIIFGLLTYCLLAYFKPHNNVPEPDEILLTNTTTGLNEIWHKDDVQSVKLLNDLYGGYADTIKKNNIRLSPTITAEYSTPLFEDNEVTYIMAEDIFTRYELWKHESPDFVTLGSSMMFVNFNRETVFNNYPDIRYIDMTIGNNHPKVTWRLLQELDKRQLKIKPGSVFVYGMNISELNEGYSENYHDWVWPILEKGSVRDKNNDKTMTTRINEFFNIQEGFYQLKRTNPYFHAINQKWIKFQEKIGLRLVYLMDIPDKYRHDGKDLKSYLLTKVNRAGPYQCKDDNRIDIVLKIRDYIQSQGGHFVLLQVPTTSFDFAKTKNMNQCFDDLIAPILNKNNIEFIDFRDHQKLGISDLDFLFPNYLDPQHMNIEGGKKFTQKILNIQTVSQALQ